MKSDLAMLFKKTPRKTVLVQVLEEHRQYPYAVLVKEEQREPVWVLKAELSKYKP